jgi:hypothetical protein
METGNGNLISSLLPSVRRELGENIKVNDDLGTHINRSAIAVDTDGNAYAVWDDSAIARFDYGDLTLLPSAAGLGAMSRSIWNLVRLQTLPVAVDSGSNAYAIWDGEDPDGVYFAYRPAGGNWGAHAKVDTVPGSSNRLPDIAVDPAGNAYAIWRGARLDFEEHDIYFAHRPANGVWGENVMINDDDGDFYQNNPAIAVDTSGNAYAVWEDDRENGPDIYFSYRPAGGAWEQNLLINQYPVEPVDQHPIWSRQRHRQGCMGRLEYSYRCNLLRSHY